jgi:hypothetical protein
MNPAGTVSPPVISLTESALSSDVSGKTWLVGTGATVTIESDDPEARLW